MSIHVKHHSRRPAGKSWPGLFGAAAIAALASPGSEAVSQTGGSFAAVGQQPAEDHVMVNGGTTSGAPGGTNSMSQFSPVSWKLGNWRGFLSFTGQLRYDDNLRQAHTNVISDFIGMASPAINIEYVPATAEKDALLHLDYAPEFLGYLEHEEFNSINHQAHVKAQRMFGRSTFRFSHTLRMTTEQALEQTSWGETHNEVTELSWAYQATEKTSLTLAPHQDWMKVANDLTVWEYGASLQLGHQWTEKTMLLASYDAAEVTSKPGNDGFKQTVLAGFSWQMSGLCLLDVQGGFQTLSISGQNDSGGGVTPDVSVNWKYQFAPKTGLRLRVSYDNNYSRYIADQVNETLAGELALAQALTEKIGLELRGGASSVSQKTAGNAAGSDGDLVYWNLGCGLAYHFDPKTEIRVDFNHQERGSNRTYSPFDRNLVQLEIRHRF
jgi:hypothetical protein